MKRVLLTGAAGDIGGRLRKLLEARLPGAAAERHQEAGRPAARRAVHRRRPRPHRGGGEGGARASRASSTSAATPWRGRGRRSCRPTSSAATICSRRRGARASSASCSPPPTTPSASIPRYHHIGTDVTVRPDSRYGVSKAFGEALGALYADKHGLRVLCLRIGNVGDQPLDQRRLSIWISPEDLAQLVRIGLEHPDLRYEIFYGASDNERSLVGQPPRLRLRLPPDRPRRGPSRARLGRAGQAEAGPGRRLLPGRHLLQRRVRRRRQPRLEVRRHENSPADLAHAYARHAPQLLRGARPGGPAGAGRGRPA